MLSFERIWCMPNRYTFKMRPVQKLLKRERVGKGWADPFAGFNSPAEIRNDLNIESNAEFHLDAIEFLKTQANESIEGVLFDPPYSPEQDKRKYGIKFAGTAGWNEYLWACKREIARIVKPNGKVLCFGWDSCGIGNKHGFTLISGLILCHGSAHRDTIITVEVKHELN